MPRYRKKALLVTVEKADIKQYITTLEGVTEAEVGDYIVTGVDNEQWALKPKWFKLAYTHVKDNVWQRKPQILTATQIDEPEITPSPNGDMKGDKGDYKVTGTKGEQWYVKPDIFDKTYEKVSDDMKKSMGEIAVRNCPIHGRYTYDMFNGTKEDTICPKCREVKKGMYYELQNNERMLNKGHIGEASSLQKAIDQIGMEAVMKSLGPNMALGYCDVHGHYPLPAITSKPGEEAPKVGCVLCPPNLANGTNATVVELVINLDPDKNLGTNPQQKKTTYEEDVRGDVKVIPSTIMP